MSEQENEQQPERRDYPGMPTTSAAALFIVGLVVMGAGVAFSTGEDGEWGIVVAAVGGIFLTIGMIAKGVELGIRNARD